MFSQHSRCRQAIHGFTLLELIIVISLLSIVVAFSLPRLHSSIFLDDTKKGSRWIISKIQALREATIRDQKQYSLHVDLDSNRLWETHAAMSAEDLENAALNAYSPPAGLTIRDIEFAGSERISTGETELRFYKNGITDKVIIHVQGDDRIFSFLLEPFLTKVKFFDHDVSFES
jgi:prepilin-type N-terminal cleavage/methylation domain-containing protein